MIAKLFTSFNPEKKSPLLAFIKFEPTFLTGSLEIVLSAPVQGEAGGRGGGGGFRPPRPARSVRVFLKRNPPLFPGRFLFPQTLWTYAGLNPVIRFAINQAGRAH